MDKPKKQIQATAAQIKVLSEFMKNHGYDNKDAFIDTKESNAYWDSVVLSLNSMGGPIKTAEKWKELWHSVSNPRKRTLKCKVVQSENAGESSNGDTSLNDTDNQVPTKKKCSSFDEQLIQIERDKLEFDKEYKVQKIDVLARIASALEELARKQ